MQAKWVNRGPLWVEDQYLVGGKVVFVGGWKIGNQEVGQWLLYGQWPTFGHFLTQEKNGCCKSFEGNTYIDTQNGQVAW